MMNRSTYICFLVMVMYIALLCGCVAEEAACPSVSGSAESVELTISTKAVSDADLSDRLTVKDIWLFQFGGTSDDSELVGSPIYLDYSSDPVEAGDDTRLVSLVTSNTGNTVVVVANTHNPDQVWSVPTLAMMKQASAAVAESEDNWSSSGNDLVMSGYTVSPITAGDALEISLSFNVAKVEFDIVNMSQSGMTLHSVTMADVPGRSHYAQALSSAGTLLSEERVDYPEENAVSGTSYFWYVPRDDEGLAHVRVLATSSDGIAYRYNIPVDVSGVEAGHRYPLSLTISEPGDPSLDDHVEKYGEIELQNANSFIVHPYPSEGVVDGVSVQRRFAIPTTQVNAYWRDIRHDDSRRLTASSAWTAEVLWQDVDGLVEVLTTSGKGPSQRIVFSVKNGAYGNAVIAMKKDGEILWTWHVWSTEYDPEYHEIPVGKKYAYPVQGGHVHRYGGDFWEPSANGTDAYVATYRDKYIMDRNLGASSPESPGLMYQFGRKDPFTKTLTNKQTTKMTMDQAVMAPMTYANVSSSDWCSDMSSFNTWNSPSAAREEKSIFDPCPPGWKIPHIDLWEDYVYTDDSNPANDTVLQEERGLGWQTDGLTGLRYWPVGVVMESPVFYPIGTILNGAYNASRVGVWSSTSQNVNNAYAMSRTAGSSMAKKGSSARSNAYPIRCVQE